mgnify:CR=1 FL=1
MGSSPKAVSSRQRQYRPPRRKRVLLSSTKSAQSAVATLIGFRIAGCYRAARVACVDRGGRSRCRRLRAIDPGRDLFRSALLAYIDRAGSRRVPSPLRARRRRSTLRLDWRLSFFCPSSARAASLRASSARRRRQPALSARRRRATSPVASPLGCGRRGRRRCRATCDRCGGRCRRGRPGASPAPSGP